MTTRNKPLESELREEITELENQLALMRQRYVRIATSHLRDHPKWREVRELMQDTIDFIITGIMIRRDEIERLTPWSK